MTNFEILEFLLLYKIIPKSSYFKEIFDFSINHTQNYWVISINLITFTDINLDYACLLAIVYFWGYLFAQADSILNPLTILPLDLLEDLGQVVNESDACPTPTSKDLQIISDLTYSKHPYNFCNAFLNHFYWQDFGSVTVVGHSQHNLPDQSHNSSRRSSICSISSDTSSNSTSAWQDAKLLSDNQLLNSDLMCVGTTPTFTLLRQCLQKISNFKYCNNPVTQNLLTPFDHHFKFNNCLLKKLSPRFYQASLAYFHKLTKTKATIKVLSDQILYFATASHDPEQIEHIVYSQNRHDPKFSASRWQKIVQKISSFSKNLSKRHVTIDSDSSSIDESENSNLNLELEKLCHLLNIGLDFTARNSSEDLDLNLFKHLLHPAIVPDTFIRERFAPKSKYDGELCYEALTIKDFFG